MACPCRYSINIAHGGAVATTADICFRNMSNSPDSYIYKYPVLPSSINIGQESRKEFTSFKTYVFLLKTIHLQRLRQLCEMFALEAVHFKSRRWVGWRASVSGGVVFPQLGQNRHPLRYNIWQWSWTKPQAHLYSNQWEISRALSDVVSPVS